MPAMTTDAKGLEASHGHRVQGPFGEPDRPCRDQGDADHSTRGKATAA